MGILIDSTAFIYAERNQRTCAQLFSDIQARHGDVELGISVMSAGELFHGCWRADSAARRARREEYVASILAAVPVIPISVPVARVFGEIDAGLRSDGQRLPTSDLLIACTALARGDEIVTGNVRHFNRVPGLIVHDFN